MAAVRAELEAGRGLLARVQRWWRTTEVAAATVVGLACLAVWLVLVWVDGGPRGLLYTGDSNVLVAGVREAIDCISDGTFVSCAPIPGTSNSNVGPFGPLQYLPAAVFVGLLGADDLRALQLLARLSTLSFLALLVLAALPFRRNVRLWPLLLVSVAFSAASFHATSAFGEMLAAAAALGAVVAGRSRRAWLVALTCFLACLMKETAPPFVVALVVLASIDLTTTWKPRVGVVVAALGSGAGAMGAMALFNVFRFGTVTNGLYLEPLFRTPGISRKIEFFVTIWLSPSSGIVVHWPLVAILLLGCTAIAVRRVLVADDRRRPEVWIPFATLALLLLFSMTLAAWFAPFGWVTFGPRLAAPMIPAFVVVLCLQCEPELTRAVGAVGSNLGRSVVVATLAGVLSVPAATTPWSHTAAIASLVAADGTCDNMNQVSVADPAYYRCFRHFAWRLRPSVLGSAVTSRPGAASTAQALGCLGAGLLVFGALRPRRDPEDQLFATTRLPG